MYKGFQDRLAVPHCASSCDFFWKKGRFSDAEVGLVRNAEKPTLPSE